jgi:cytochrome c peroxidase
VRAAHRSLTLAWPAPALVLALACSGPSGPQVTGAGGSAGQGAAGTSTGGKGGGEVEQPPTFTSTELSQLRTLSPSSLPRVPADITNRFADDASAAAFGQRLFFERGFSGKLLDGDNDGTPNALGAKGETGRVSCAGCHVPDAGFLDNRTLGKQISLAAGWGKRRAPSLLDVGQATLLMWDGRHDTLYNQPFGPLESPAEMNSSRLYVAERTFALHREEYEAIFGEMPPLDDPQRFPEISAELTGCEPTVVDQSNTCNGVAHGIPGDQAEFDGLSAADQDAVTEVVVNLGKALGAYERLLDCGPGRFDAFIAGDPQALTPSEQRGAQLFVGAGQCINCHAGPFLSDQEFHNVGLRPAPVAVVFIDQDDSGASLGLAAALADPLNSLGKFSDGDDGRLPPSVAGEMLGAFRTPALRCAARRPSFMHTGQLKTLAEVVAFFNRGGDLFGYLGVNELAPLGLSPQDERDLVAFLGTLEGPGPAAELLVEPANP